VLEVEATFCNQAESIFQDGNNTPTKQTTKQELDQNKIYLCSYLCYSGESGL
jgi:hypothetical protein